MKKQENVFEEQEEIFEEQSDSTQKQVTVTQFKCPSCGNNFEFDPEGQDLKCPYCGKTVSIEAERADELRLSDDFDEAEVFDDTLEVFRCENCGAMSEKRRDGIAFVCPYCHKTNILAEKEIKGIKPNGVIPFKVGLGEAYSVFKNWIKKKAFAPKKIKKIRIDGEFNGIYSPCWTFDASTFSVYKGRIGKTYTRTVGSGKNKHVVTSVRWRNISGTYQSGFDDVKVSASDTVSERQFDKVANYDTNSAVKYEESFLAGFSAMHYKIGLKSAWQNAKSDIDEMLKEQILSQYSHDRVDYLNVNTSYSNKTYKYLLLPFYINTYSFKKKMYCAIVNGASGKIWGSYPKSPLKVTLAILILLILAGGLYLLHYFGII